MKRAVLGGLLAVALAAILLGLAFMLTEGGLFSRARYEWRVEVSAADGDSWSVDVPRLVNGTSVHAAGNASLAEFLTRLAVQHGEATFELRDEALRVSGRGDALVAALWTGPRNAGSFTDWRASSANVSRAHDAEGSAPVQLTWSIDLSGGRGHTCSARDSHSIQLLPGEVKPLPARGDVVEPQTRLWQTTCA